jgi:hypothetical protein
VEWTGSGRENCDEILGCFCGFQRCLMVFEVGSWFFDLAHDFKNGSWY